MPAHKEEQDNRFELCKMLLLWMWKNKILKNPDLVLKLLPLKFEQVSAKFPKGTCYLFST